MKVLVTKTKTNFTHIKVNVEYNDNDKHNVKDFPKLKVGRKVYIWQLNKNNNNKNNNNNNKKIFGILMEKGTLDFTAQIGRIRCLKGYCTSYQKLACFILYLKKINTFLENNICII